MRVPDSQLHHLAQLYGIKTSYLDMQNQISPASNQSLIAVLKAMGAPVAKMEDVPTALREKRQQQWRQFIEPVITVRNRDMLTVNLHLPASLIDTPITANLMMEGGEKRNLVWRTTESVILDSATIERERYVTVRLYLPEVIPTGYHYLSLELPGQIAETLIISAPAKAFDPLNTEEKIWGVFLPLYALKTRQSWGTGDFHDLETLIKWLSGLGGHLAGTLPLLSSFFDEQFGPGPYMPASRLFWNEIYLNINDIPESQDYPEANKLVNSNEYQRNITSLNKSRRVDYMRSATLKRQVLEGISDAFFRKKSDRFQAFQQYLESNPQAEDYARFRAAGEKHGICWHKWPKRMRNGKLNPGDYSEKTKQYYLFSQWLTSEQIENLFNKAQQEKTYIYMDVPVGVHPYSYDVWREQDSFVMDVTGGAPPDPVFTSGQNWCFPPLHPEKIRQHGYNYFINSLRHQLRQCGMLRIDHMMNFHRLFWIPKGMENKDGVYVSYRAEEMYAILALESCRKQSVIIGEDLGIVPPEVRPMMEKHNIYRMFVGQYELITENQLGKIPPRSIASLNTHDMFPFAAFWEELDIAERLKLKLVDEKLAQKELEQRRLIKRILISILQYRGLDNEISQDTRETMKSILKLIAASPAYALLINLEDLWLETHPQNIPGTTRKQNWSRKAMCSFEQFSRSPLILEILREVDRARKGV